MMIAHPQQDRQFAGFPAGQATRLAALPTAAPVDLVALIKSGKIAESRRVAAGIPDVATLRAELARRAHAA